MDIYEQALAEHARLKGKVSVHPKATVDSAESLATLYTPGIGAVSQKIHAHPETLGEYTWVNNAVAVISDGSAVLGLGDIGPGGALPVMEGKALLFKQFAGVDAVPIVLDVHTVEEIIATIKAISPGFGGINLEDIASPKCFEIERRLIDELSIPVMHDDQHGTAIVVLAGLINACKVVGKKLEECKIVLVGAGAAGTAIAKLLEKYANPEMIVVDSQGVITTDRPNLSPEKEYLSKLNLLAPGNEYTMEDAMLGADIVIGVSKAGMIHPEHIRIMSDTAIVFALANPEPEITPEDALKAGAKVVATGRSDYPNQINNVLVFPGVFRGALDNRIETILDTHKIAAAEALASLITEPTAEYIIPSVLDPRVVEVVAQSVR
jgi:malate dehydrogenase (oxaloacetate-decarboxylating)